MVAYADTLTYRLARGLVLNPDTGCMEWTGHLTNSGYGTIKEGGRGTRTLKAHRLAYEQAYGPIPDGLVLDHLCRNRKCCNPDHLEAVTMQVNTLRGASPIAELARKTHCPHGHPYDAENTIWRANGARACKGCREDRNRLRRKGSAAPST